MPVVTSNEKRYLGGLKWYNHMSRIQDAEVQARLSITLRYISCLAGFNGEIFFLMTGRSTGERAAASVATQPRCCPLYGEQSDHKKKTLFDE